MKAQTKFFTAAAVTAIAGLFSAAPAQAITLGPGLIEGDGSHVYFDFHESHGFFQSDFGVYNNTTETFFTLLGEVQRNDDGISRWATDHLGTCGDTVTNCEASFTFLEDNEYAFFLRNTGDGDHTKTIFSANELNPIQGWTEFVDQTKFFTSKDVLTNDPSYGTYESLTSDLAFAASETYVLENGMSAVIAFEDQGIDTRGTGDYFHGDWNDFIVKVSVPEPATIIGLGVVAGAMALYRRRKQDKAS